MNIYPQTFASNPIPPCAGIGLRAQHYEDVLSQKPDIGWFEVHSENYFGEGGRPHYYLEKIRQDYPISLHGVGLSIGSTDELNSKHLKRLGELIHQYEPGLISEHLSWSHVSGRYFNDLIPLPYTTAALQHMVSRMKQIQEYLGRQMLIENVSSYLEYKESSIAEDAFLNELAHRSGCGILLDVNNVYVNSQNHGQDASRFIQNISADHVKEIHLAGHTVNQFSEGKLVIDSHDNLVCDAVWDLYSEAVTHFQQVPALIEWDANIPSLEVLLTEAGKADDIAGVNHEHAQKVANRF